MRSFFALLFLAFAAALGQAQAVLPSWDSGTQAAWWTQNPGPDSWPKAAGALQAQLEAAYQQNGASVLSQSDFQAWLDHLQWIRLDLSAADLLADPKTLQTFVALGKDEAVSHLFIEKMEPYDVKKKALQNLLELATANRDDLHEYAALGVAYALVFDEPFPAYWPHPQVNHSAVPIGDLDVVPRFNFYVQANRDKKTELDLTQQSFENLKFLVNSEVSLSELQYAQASSISYSHFADAFFSINYDQSRVKDGNFFFQWGFPTYTLKDIETHGGICVDQAYYATILGKGRGIPTIYFQGEGADGGHAWFGYLSNSGKWELDCGRYESQNYPKGYALDPQGWHMIDDTMLDNLAKNGTDPNYQAAKAALAWAYLHENNPTEVTKILDDARSLMPGLAQTWQVEGKYLEYLHTSSDALKTFYQAWVTQFQNFNDMKVQGQKLLLAVLKASNDPDADQVQRDIVLENRSSDFDQGIQGSFGAISDKLKSQDWDGARLEYEKTIRDFGDQGGGTLFYNVITPYVNSCLDGGHSDQADDGIRFAEDRMTVTRDSILSQGFGKLKEKVAEAKKTAAGP